MFNIPLTFDGEWFRIMAIDPGTTTFGVAILDWKYGTELARVRWAHTLKETNSAQTDSFEEMCGKRDVRIAGLARDFAEILDFSFPNFVITETSFSQRGKANAYESGIEVNSMMRRALWDFSPAMPLHGINPRSVKNYVGVSHVGTEKDDVKKAVIALYKDNTDIDLETLDEHSIDAIAVGNFFVRFHLLALNSLYAAPEKKKKVSRRRPRRRKRK